MSDKNDYVNSRGNPPQVFLTTLPSWLKDFNGPLCIENWYPDEGYCNMFRLPVVLVKFTTGMPQQVQGEQ